MFFQFCPSVLLWNNNNILTTIFSSNVAVCVVSFGRGKKDNVMFDSVTPGAHQMEPLSPLISWVNPFPLTFINRTTFFFNAWIAWMRTCCPLFELRQYYCHSSISIGSFPISVQTVLYINLRGKRLTPMACMGDRGSIWWAPCYTNWIRKGISVPHL